MEGAGDESLPGAHRLNTGGNGGRRILGLTWQGQA